MDDEASKLRALSDIASIDITLEFDEILYRILKLTCKNMNAHSGTIMLVDEVTNDLRMVASYGLGHDYIDRVYAAAEKARVPLTSSPSGTVLKTGRYYPVPNILEEPKDRPWYDLARELGFSSQIFTPMKRGCRVIGLLNIYWADPQEFQDDEINFVTVAASQAASVVQNARICTRLRHNIHELNEYKQHLEEKIKETHRKLYDSEKYIRTVINSSLDGICVLNQQGIFEFGNSSFFRIIGWSEEEIIGHHFKKIIPEDMVDVIFQQWHDVQEGVLNDLETRIITRTGEIKYVIAAHALTDINGEKKIVTVIKDITEHKRLESNLKESEARYRDLFENADDPMFTLDTRSCFVEINRAGLKTLGCSKEEIIGTHISKWLTKESLGIVQDAIKKSMLGEPVEPPPILEIVCRNGEHRFVETRSRTLKDGDRITGIHGIARDITEKKKLEEKLRKYHEQLVRSYEELKEADRLKTEFISNITHELLTPLTSIKGFAELLNDEEMGSVSDEQKKCLGIIHRNSDRLINLIKQLLDAAHLEKDILEMEFGPVSINSVILKSIQDVHPQAKEKHITINQDIQPLPDIWGDEERLMQVMTNVLTNAIKFTDQRGNITIKAYEDADRIRISITDTGTGIPADKLTRIFDRFYQVDGSTRRKYGGVGLGLSICKSIIEKHSGSIWAESSGSGSTFHIVLPRIMDQKQNEGEC